MRVSKGFLAVGCSPGLAFVAWMIFEATFRDGTWSWIEALEGFAGGTTLGLIGTLVVAPLLRVVAHWRKWTTLHHHLLYGALSGWLLSFIAYTSGSIIRTPDVASGAWFARQVPWEMFLSLFLNVADILGACVGGLSGLVLWMTERPDRNPVGN